MEEDDKSLTGDGLFVVVSFICMGLDTDDRGAQFSTGGTEFLRGKL